jgi:hypothetical protein
MTLRRLAARDTEQIDAPVLIEVLILDGMIASRTTGGMSAHFTRIRRSCANDPMICLSEEYTVVMTLG